MTEPILYVPAYLADPAKLRLPDVHSTWKGLECVIPSILDRFSIDNRWAIEFGVWYGYSTGALANFFKNVVGIDHFQGDKDAGMPSDLYERAYEALEPFPHVALLKEDYKEFLKWDPIVDLIHIDIVHDYEPTYELGKWACGHAQIVLFHDTESFPTVRQAVSDLAEETGRTFYNYPEHYGLGMLVKP